MKCSLSKLEYSKKYYKDNLSKNKIRYRKNSSYYRKQNPVLYLFYMAKYRAKKKYIEFSISFEDLVIPTHCPVLGIELVSGAGKGKFAPNSYSIDRINPNLGYIKGNVRIISWRANELKKNATHKELKALYEDSLRLNEEV